MRYLGSAVCAALAVLFAWLFHARYWTWRDCINAAKSSCITPDGAVLIGGGAFWSVFAVLFALLALVLAWRARRC